MTLAAAKTYTPEEFLELPDSMAYELVDGHLVERNVSAKSSMVAMRIGYQLTRILEQTDEAYVFGSDLSYQCFSAKPKMIRRADVSLIRKSRLTDIDDAGTMPIAADLVVEVLSPNDQIYHVNKKVELYLSAGVGLVWVVDPEVKIVFVHRLDGSVSKLREEQEITGEAALPGFRCKVAEFFPR